MEVRLTTWNLQGRERPDVASVVAVLMELDADVVLLQEVQRRQAHAIGRRLGWSSVSWRLKHWPLVIPAEGLAVLARNRFLHAEVTVLARRWAWWSSHRRIAAAADVRTDGGVLRVVGTHLGAGVGDAERSRQAVLVVALATKGAAPSVIGGDLNTEPGSRVIETLGSAGHRDSWPACHGDDPGPTNWTPGPRHDAPVQRLDYLLVDRSLDVVDVTVPRHGDPGFERFGPLSDHLPVTATVAMRDG